MKVGFYVLSAALIFSLSNCAKTNKDIPNTPADSVINSVILSASVQNNTATIQSTEKDSFIYDLQGRLISIVNRLEDKDVNMGEFHDSVFYIFNYSGNDSVPSSMVSPGLFSRTIIVSHEFTFDSQSRIIRDSSSEGCVNNFVYNTPYIYATRYHPTISSGSTIFYENFITDTVLMNDDNISHILEYSFLDQKQATGLSVVIENAAIPYSAYRNPFYNSLISPSIGLILHFIAKGNGYIYDFYSKNLYSQFYYDVTAMPVWQTDSLGRVNEGTFSLSGHDYLMSFNYKN
jgi:hypothetical protein